MSAAQWQGKLWLVWFKLINSSFFCSAVRLFVLQWGLCRLFKLQWESLQATMGVTTGLCRLFKNSVTIIKMTLLIKQVSVPFKVAWHCSKTQCPWVGQLTHKMFSLHIMPSCAYYICHFWVAFGNITWFVLCVGGLCCVGYRKLLWVSFGCLLC